MSATNLTPEEFMLEVKRWGATSDALIRVRMMRKGKTVHFRLKLPNNGEIIQTKFPRKDYENFGFLNLNAIAVPAVWEDETEQINQLNKKIDESINANNQSITSDWYKNIQY